MLYGKGLRDYLAYQVLGTRKKPPQQSQIPRRGKAQPRKGPPRNEAYKAWIRTLPCLCCGIEHRSEAAHTGTDGSMSMKASDYSTVPLCANCHTQAPDCYHSAGGKRRMERRIGQRFADICDRLRREWKERAA